MSSSLFWLGKILVSTIYISISILLPHRSGYFELEIL